MLWTLFSKKVIGLDKFWVLMGMASYYSTNTKQGMKQHDFDD
ncbi:hypothetical protein [Paenibacillus agricola]|nr:hypothetical protein [Paenibacillus agricola]